MNGITLEQASAVAGGALAHGRGGVLVRTADGTLLGAVGISGDTSEQDEACALRGIKNAGLVADTG